MKTFSITDFKAHALQLINHIIKTQESIVVTKHGKPVVEVLPFTQKEDKPIPGKLAHFYKDEIDILAPFGENIWNAAQ